MNKRLSPLLMRAAGVLEACVSLLIIAVLFAACCRLAAETLLTLRGAPGNLSLNLFLSDALELIVGVEFVKMLLKHTPGAVVEVLLFAIARELVVLHTGALDTLLGVIAVAALFAIRRYLYRADSPREETLDAPASN